MRLLYSSWSQSIFIGPLKRESDRMRLGDAPGRLARLSHLLYPARTVCAAAH